ncbi:hypothetical protein [Bifidobacterium apicola]|uniref:hypothetical protein n=1 Tax=Bifidobacterium apicola TaxID=3230739 RepID=UPI0036F31E47
MIERDRRGSTGAGSMGRGMRERLAVYGLFVIMGIGTSAWISRLPTVKVRLGPQPSGLALMTILGGCGALIGMLVQGDHPPSTGSWQPGAMPWFLCLP